MSNIYKFFKLKNNSLKNYIFNFLDHKEMFVVRNLNKTSRNIVDKYQKIFAKYVDYLKKLKKRYIKSFENLIDDINSYYEIIEEDEIFQQIFDYLFKNQEYEFNFDFKGIAVEAIKRKFNMIIKGLKKNRNLKIIGISNINKLNENDKEFYYFKLIDIIKINNHITTINLNGNEIGLNFDYIKYLSEALIENHSIISINLFGNMIGSNPQNMKILAEALTQNKSIKSINLGYNMIGTDSENMKYLSEALKNNRSISSIDLFYNYLGILSDNMKYLKEGLIENNHIISISLRFNQIGSFPDHMKHFKELLILNNNVRNINLISNKIGSNIDDLKHIVEGLKKNDSINVIKLSGNNISQIGYHRARSQLVLTKHFQNFILD